ncbi:MAG: hypothetical protein DCF12_20895 [Snowella sp.]|nr:MAG: hypothetical protein DCF12_20895 [Snowella sp.]
MKANFFQLITGAAIVGTIGSGVFTPAQAIQVWSLNFAPEVTGATGTGTGSLTYDNIARTLTVASTFSGLSGNTTNAHIHAPTTVAGTGTVSVAVPFVLGVSGFPLGVTSGSHNTVLNLALDSTYNTTFRNNFGGGTAAGAEAALIASFNAGTAYYNIHTSTFGGGEIRAFATAVPWETDALSVVGTTLLFGFGIWRKNKVSQRNLK